MARFVGLSVNKGKGGGGGSVKTEPYTRSSGITTNSSNNVTSVTLGDTKYSAVKYDNVGLVTGFNETIGGSIKGWVLEYDSEGLVTAINERSAPHFDPSYSVSTTSTAVNEGASITFNVTTTQLADGTTVYYDTNLSDSDFSGSTENGSFTITSGSGSFSVTLANDLATEGTETLVARLYDDAGRTNEVASSNSVTINDTSISIPSGAVFHANGYNQSANYNWTVPAGVTSISVVCVGGGGSGEQNHDGASGGGGGLGYKNNISVTPGANVAVTVGGGGYGSNGQTDSENGRGSYITYAGTIYSVGNGGTGADGNQTANAWYDNSGSFTDTNCDGGGAGGAGFHGAGFRSGGGGAGGYNGGGNTTSGYGCNSNNYQVPGAGSNGGGGGGSASNGSSSYYSAGGGGTGVYGQGTNGARGDANNNGSPDTVNDFCGGGGSTAYNTGLRGYSVESPNSTYAAGSDLGNGYDRSTPTNGQSGTRPDGGFPGGGGGGGNSGHSCGQGGHGIVRIVWGTVSGVARAFPSTNVNRIDNYDASKTETVYGTQLMY